MEEKMKNHVETVDFVGFRSSGDEDLRVDA